MSACQTGTLEISFFLWKKFVFCFCRVWSRFSRFCLQTRTTGILNFETEWAIFVWILRKKTLSAASTVRVSCNIWFELVARGWTQLFVDALFARHKFWSEVEFFLEKNSTRSGQKASWMKSWYIWTTFGDFTENCKQDSGPTWLLLADSCMEGFPFLLFNWSRSQSELLLGTKALDKMPKILFFHCLGRKLREAFKTRVLVFVSRP